MKIVFYLPSFAGGGAERVFVRLAGIYAEADREVQMIVNTDDGPLRSLLSDRVGLLDLQAKRARDAVPKMMRYLSSEKPEVILSALTFNNLGVLAARMMTGARTRIVISQRNQLSAMLGQTKGLKRPVTGMLVRALYRRADAITAVTEGVAKDLERIVCIPSDRLHVIENSAPDAAEIEDARSAPSPHLWFSEDQPVLVAIGRLMPQKNYPVLLQAMAILRDQGRPMRLIVLGEGPERGDLEDRARALGLDDSVCFQGFAMNRLDYLVRASVYVLSSDFEGFPNALVEAVACSVPVVSTNCDGNGPREILGADLPESLVPVGDAQALATTILAQHEVPPAHETLARITRHWSMERMAERYLALLTGLAQPA